MTKAPSQRIFFVIILALLFLLMTAYHVMAHRGMNEHDEAISISLSDIYMRRASGKAAFLLPGA